MQTFRINIVNSSMEAVNWVGDDALDDHVWCQNRPYRCRKQKFWRLCNMMSKSLAWFGGYAVLLGTNQTLRRPELV